jgi:hypothetical protein
MVNVRNLGRDLKTSEIPTAQSDKKDLTVDIISA